MSNIPWFQLRKCEYLLLFFFVSFMIENWIYVFFWSDKTSTLRTENYQRIDGYIHLHKVIYTHNTHRHIYLYSDNESRKEVIAWYHATLIQKNWALFLNHIRKMWKYKAFLWIIEKSTVKADSVHKAEQSSSHTPNTISGTLFTTWVCLCHFTPCQDRHFSHLAQKSTGQVLPGLGKPGRQKGGRGSHSPPASAFPSSHSPFAPTNWNWTKMFEKENDTNSLEMNEMKQIHRHCVCSSCFFSLELF